MSQKNHKMTDGKLLQTDKKYAQLKLKQKEKIAEWMFQVTRDYYTKNYTFPNDRPQSRSSLNFTMVSVSSSIVAILCCLFCKVKRFALEYKA